MLVDLLVGLSVVCRNLLAALSACASQYLGCVCPSWS